MEPTSSSNAPLPGDKPLRRIDGVQGSPSQQAKLRATEAPAFRALLDRLQAQAQDLAREKEGVDRPAELSQATERARETLSGALELRDQLLEAYRQVRSQARPEDAGDNADEKA